MLRAANQTQMLAPNSQGTSTLTGAPPGATGQLSWRLINDADGTIVIAETTEGIVEIDDGHDSGLSRYDRPFTAPTNGRYLAIWRYFLEEIAQPVVVSGVEDIAFASPDDVQLRLKRSLTAAESDTVPFLLTMAAAVIADAAGYDDGWAATLNPVPNLLRMLSVELVCRNLANPKAYSSVRQQAGSYSFQADMTTVGMILTDPEVMMVRRAVHGRTTDSTPVESGIKRALDEYWLRKQAVRMGDPSSPSEVIA